MNYYTLKGSNANNFFKIDLHPDKYYDWDDVKKRAVANMEDIIDDKDRDEIESNVTLFQEIIDGRRRREKKIKDKFKQKDIKFIPHSYYTRNYIMYNRNDFDDVVKKMYIMKVLFENCDILNKWEDYKVKTNKQIYSFEEKDKFYKDTYDKFIIKNPRFML